MKLIFFTFLSFFYLWSNAQLLDPSANWFTEENFFNQQTLQNHQIKSISIAKRTKLDGKYFSSEKEVLRYNFTTSGQLIEALKFTSFTNRTDSSRFQFFYNKSGTIFKRVEEEGPFSFTYYFIYNDKKLEKEIKIYSNSPNLDTAYIRYYEHKTINNNSSKITCFNSIQRPYQYINKQFDAFGQLVHQKTSLARSLNFTEKEYNYRANQLIEKKFFTSIGKQQTHLWKYSYKSGILDFIKHYRNGILIEKIGFTYRKKGLVSAAVVRDTERQSVTIYKFDYDFFN